jgi:hypothetical protein
LLLKLRFETIAEPTTPATGGFGHDAAPSMFAAGRNFPVAE